MKLTFEYGKAKFVAELSDTDRNARLALQLAWDLVDEDTRMIFMPDYSKQAQHKTSSRQSLIKSLSRKTKQNSE